MGVSPAVNVRLHGVVPVILIGQPAGILNLKTAKTLGLTIPSGALAITDEVIEWPQLCLRTLLHLLRSPPGRFGPRAMSAFAPLLEVERAFGGRAESAAFEPELT